MRTRDLIFVSLFSFFYIDLNHLRRSRRVVLSAPSIAIEFGDQKEKLKRKKRKYRNRKYKRRQYYQRKSFKLKGTQSKDSRYSNQKDIRRMHTSYA